MSRYHSETFSQIFHSFKLPFYGFPSYLLDFIGFKGNNCNNASFYFRAYCFKKWLGFCCLTYVDSIDGLKFGNISLYFTFLVFGLQIIFFWSKLPPFARKIQELRFLLFHVAWRLEISYKKDNFSSSKNFVTEKVYQIYNNF